MAESPGLSRRPFRTLVVVPRSHADGTFEQYAGANGRGMTKCSGDAIASRAIQLDLRPPFTPHGYQLRSPTRSHSSLCVVWDSRLIHQGHTHFEGSLASGWSPPLWRPPFYHLDDKKAWWRHLDEEGYVVFVNVFTSEEIEEALRLLLYDLQLLNPALPGGIPTLNTLGDVQEYHLPASNSSNDLRATAGLCHGAFAWHLRTRPVVARIFDQLFPVCSGALTGSVDVVALAPPGSTRAVGGHGKRWLHLDYTPPNGRIWQASFQLFPNKPELGSFWERIGIMICKAPSAWMTPRGLHSLLACCVTGAASRATAGVTQGLVHGECKKVRRGLPRILPELRYARIAAACTGEDVVRGSDSLPYYTLRQSTPQSVTSTYSIEQLEELLPQHVLEYIRPNVYAPRGLHGGWGGERPKAPVSEDFEGARRLDLPKPSRKRQITIIEDELVDVDDVEDSSEPLAQVSRTEVDLRLADSPPSAPGAKAARRLRVINGRS